MASPDLLELAAVEQDDTKRILFKYVPICHCVEAGVVVATLFTPLPWAYFLAIIVLVLQLTVWLLRGHALELHRHADEARRRALLIQALDQDAECFDATNIRAEFSERVHSAASLTDHSSYWETKTPPGVRRLLEELQESAFWSRHLYGAAARMMYWTLGVVAAVLGAVVLVGLGAFSGDTSLAVARVIVVALSSLIGLDLLGQALSWRNAATQSERVARRVEQLDGASVEPLLAVVADYAVATASAPPIPDRIYKANAARLDELWTAHRAGAHWNS